MCCWKEHLESVMQDSSYIQIRLVRAKSSSKLSQVKSNSIFLIRVNVEFIKFCLNRTRFSSTEDSVLKRRNTNGRFATPTYPLRPGMLYGCQQRARYRLPMGFARKPQTVIPSSLSHSKPIFFIFFIFTFISDFWQPAATEAPIRRPPRNWGRRSWRRTWSIWPSRPFWQCSTSIVIVSFTAM